MIPAFAGTPPVGVRVLIATRPVDFRKGMDGLAALAKETLAQDPFSGIVLVFRAKRADRVKLLLWDGTGMVLVSKRLEQGAFKWPPIMDGLMRLSPAQLAALIEGLDWSRVHVPRVLRPRATQ
jgi:transposase